MVTTRPPLRRSALALATFLALSGAAPALAEGPPTVQVATSSTAARPAAPAALDDPGWRAFRDGMLELARGERERARGTFESLVRTMPDHPAVSLAVEALAAIGRPDLAAPGGAGERRLELTDLGARLRAESPTGLARAELVTGQTVHGLVTGIELCVLTECDDVRLAIATVMASAGAGLALSLITTSDGITAGHAAAVNAGTEWGAWNALALNVAAYDADSSKLLAGSLILGQLAGTAAGTIAWRLTGASAGDVSFSNTVGLWSGVLAALLSNIPDGTSSRAMFGISLAASDAGLLAGALLTKLTPMSRGRALLIDLTAGLGLLSGFGIDLLIVGEDASRGGAMAAGSAGLVAGLALGYWLTRTWDLPDAPEVHVGVVPTNGGGQVVAGFAW